MARDLTISPRQREEFQRRYGPWAVVAGASEGLGAAYAHALARRGIDVVLIARRGQLVEEIAARLRESYGVDARCLPGDLARTDFLESVIATCSSLDVGLIIYNAAHAPIGDFDEVPIEELSRVVDVNVRGPLTLVRALLPAFSRRGCGGVLLMTSLAGNQGSPHIATYAASKAFTRVLAEGLWHELKDRGIDVVACCAGAVRTPGYSVAAHAVPDGEEAPGTLDPDQVVEEALRALGRGPVIVPGRFNRVASAFMSRALPRRTAISIMARNTDSLAPARHVADPAQSPRSGGTTGGTTGDATGATTGATTSDTDVDATGRETP